MWSMSPAPSSLSVPPFLAPDSSSLLLPLPPPLLPPQAAAVSARPATRAAVESPLRLLSIVHLSWAPLGSPGKPLSRRGAPGQETIASDLTPSSPDSSQVTQPSGRDDARAPRDRDARVTPCKQDPARTGQSAANRQMAANSTGSRLAPPTSAPSTSGCSMISATFAAFTEPPYSTRTPSASSPG